MSSFAMRIGIGAVLPFAASVLGAGEAAATPSACDAIVGNLVNNCGFETTTGWSPSVEQNTNPGAHTGSFAEYLGPNNPPSGRRNSRFNRPSRR